MPVITLAQLHRLWRARIVFALACAGCVHAALAPVTPPSTDAIEVDVRTSVDTVARIAYVRAAFDGTPTTLALVRQPSGRFTGAIPTGAQRVTLTVSVPEHGVLETQATLPPERPAVFRVRSRPVFPRDTITDVRVEGDFNDWKARPTDRLRPSRDGHLRVAIPYTGDSTRFQIRGIGGPSDAAWMPVRSYAIAPDSADEVSFAGFVRPVHDSLVFDIDTARLRYRSTTPELRTVTADSVLALTNALAFERVDALRHSGVLRALRPSQQDSTKARALAHTKLLLTTPQDARVRAAALITAIMASDFRDARPVAESRALLAENGPQSAITRERLGVEAFGLAIVFAESPTGPSSADSNRMQERIVGRTREYLLPAALDAHADIFVRKAAYMQIVFQTAATKARTGLDAVIAEAIAAFPADPDLARLPAAFGAQRTLRPGIAFPTFHLAALGGGAAEITNETFRGKLTLIDFWATWCAPCMEEMPVLHRAYERFKGRGFTILSVSSDESVATIDKLRLGKWPMPWLHAWSGAGLDTAPLKAMGVIGLPTAVLVDSTGTIIAVNTGLRGEALERTLAGLLP